MGMITKISDLESLLLVYGLCKIKRLSCQNVGRIFIISAVVIYIIAAKSNFEHSVGMCFEFFTTLLLHLYR